MPSLLDRWFGAPKASDKAESPDSQKALQVTSDLVQTYQSFGWPWGSYGAMYRKQPSVRTVVDFLARNIAQLNPKVYYRLSTDDRRELDDHRLTQLLRKPNGVTTRYAHLRDTVADMAIYDTAYWLKMMSGARTEALWRVPPSQLTSHVDPNTQAITYKIAGSDERLTRERLVIFHGYSPDGDEMGVSPLETLRRILAEEWSSSVHREKFWDNAARQSGWIERPLDAPDWSDDARSRFRVDMESTVTGNANSGRIGVLEDGMKWNGTAFSPRESQYTEGRMLALEEVCRTYGIPSSIIGGGGETKANVESFHRQLYQDVLGPWLRFIQDEIELQLLPEFETKNSDGRVYVEFNLAEKLKGSFEEQGRTLVTAVGVPYMTANEARARLNLPRIADESFDMPVQPMNVVYGGQPAVTVPTEDPGTRSRKPGRKAASRGAIRRRDEAAKDHKALFRRMFKRQEDRFINEQLGKSKAVDDERWRKWDEELTADLYLEALALATGSGRRAARQLNGQYDASRTEDYLDTTSRITAEGVNKHTREAVAAAADADGVRDVFATAQGSRAEALGVGVATGIINFARTEAARQSSEDGRERTKTWIVTSARSRHPEMNGQTVGASEVFSNGALWPGDPVLSVDQVARCQCLLALS